MKHKDFFIGLGVGLVVTYLFYKYKPKKYKGSVIIGPLEGEFVPDKANWTGDNFSKNPNDPQSQPYVMSIKG